MDGWKKIMAKRIAGKIRSGASRAWDAQKKLAMSGGVGAPAPGSEKVYNSTLHDRASTVAKGMWDVSKYAAFPAGMAVDGAEKVYDEIKADPNLIKKYARKSAIARRISTKKKGM